MEERRCARVFIINEKNQILLQKFEFTQVKGNKVLWVTPGGGVKGSESYKQTIERELFEELRLEISIENEPILEKDVLIDGKKGEFNSHEVYYLLTLNSKHEFSLKNMTNNEKNTFQGLKWWSIEKLREQNNFAPEEITKILEDNSKFKS